MGHWKSPAARLIVVCVLLPVDGAFGQTTRASTNRGHAESGTAGEALRALSDVRRGEQRSDEQIALRAALVFFIATGEGATDKAASVLDAVGYQELPLEGPLPEIAERPVRREELAERIGGVSRFASGGFPMGRVEVMTRRAARNEFPAVADWMLPKDMLIVFRAAGEEGSDDPLRVDAVLVVRLRARKPTIVAGTLLECLRRGAGGP